MISPILANALQGMQAAQGRLAGHADRVARWGEGRTGSDPAREIAGVLDSARSYEANAAVARTADRMLGSIIDILA